MLENSALFIFRWTWVPLALLYLIGKYGKLQTRYRLKQLFRRERFAGQDGKHPHYIRVKVINEYLEQHTFKSLIPFSKWEKLIPELEVAFRRKIHNIKVYKTRKNKENIIMINVNVKQNPLPDYIEWQDAFLQDGGKFAVGMGYEGLVIVDTAIHYHLGIFGSTGGAKTSTIRLFCHQAIPQTK